MNNANKAYVIPECFPPNKIQHKTKGDNINLKSFPQKVTKKKKEDMICCCALNEFMFQMTQL